MSKEAAPEPLVIAIETDDPQFQGNIFVARNITDRKRAERRIRYLARYDALTKIPNRMQFHHLLQQTIARGLRSGQVVQGTFIGGTARQVRMDLNGETRTFDITDVVSISFSDQGAQAAPRQKFSIPTSRSLAISSELRVIPPAGPRPRSRCMRVS